MKSGYTSHIKICEIVCKVIPVEKRGDVRILDVGAGTGLAAIEVGNISWREINVKNLKLNQISDLNFY